MVLNDPELEALKARVARLERALKLLYNQASISGTPVAELREKMEAL